MTVHHPTTTRGSEPIPWNHRPIRDAHLVGAINLDLAPIAVCRDLRKTGAGYDVLCERPLGVVLKCTSRIRGACWGWWPYR